MKTYLLGLLFLGLTNLSFAQNDLAAVTVNQTNYTSTRSAVKNLDYKTSFYNKDMSKHILKFQNVVANYNVKNASVYNENRLGTYTVTFKEGQNKITAVYNNEGEIITCNEVYNDIKIPFNLSSKIVKQNPGWKMDAVTCSISYNQDQTEIAYQVVLKKGNKSKRLHIKA